MLALPIARRGILAVLRSPLKEGVAPAAGGNPRDDFGYALSQFTTGAGKKEDLIACIAASNDPRISFVVADMDIRAFMQLAVV